MAPSHFRALFLTSFLVAGCAPEEAPSLHNVVLVSIDTLRPDHMSLYGYPRETTPFLDSLAAESVVFENAYAQANMTLISHMSMLTSLYPAAHGVEPPSSVLSGKAPYLPELLKAAGYDTFGYYGLDWMSPKFGFGRGFDTYERQTEIEIEQGIESVLELLDARATQDRSFFLFLHLRDVHCRLGGGPGTPMYDAPAPFRDAFLPHPEVPVTHRPKDVWEGTVKLSQAEAANVVARYDGGILYADEIVRRVVERMRSLDLFDEALIVVTSDHGESLGQRGYFQSHGDYFEEGLRIPLLLKLPDAVPERERTRGVVATHTVQSIDIAPTILRANGIHVPATMQGTDLLDPRARDVVAHSEAHKRSVLIRDSRKLFVRRGPKASEELFDLASDPLELHPLGARDSETLGELRATLDRFLSRDGLVREQLSEAGTEPAELDDGERERLKALGYLD
ncbi:MAG: sulfatase [Acidobacteriota bacterium]|nr:sulfatase [Acidobacteriota bacterium]